MMQMRRRRDGDGIDAEIEQFIESATAGQPSAPVTKSRCCRIGIGHADQLDARQPGKHAGVVRAHDADADHADAQR